MPEILLRTQIAAPISRVFDLARSIDAHVASTAGTDERPVGGRLSGLIELHEYVTWEARHLGVMQRLTVEITRMERPHVFEDRMVRGAFKTMHHRHEFSTRGGSTEMVDTFFFEAPVPIVGWLVERVFLTRYMTRFLLARGEALKRMCESEEWKQYL